MITYVHEMLLEGGDDGEGFIAEIALEGEGDLVDFVNVTRDHVPAVEQARCKIQLINPSQFINLVN